MDWIKAAVTPGIENLHEAKVGLPRFPSLSLEPISFCPPASTALGGLFVGGQPQEAVALWLRFLSSHPFPAISTDTSQ
jgi:hypothetical protein